MDRSFLLQTKFLVPRYGKDLVPRPELIDRLHAAVSKRLTLLSAPPGYGKTTILADLTEKTSIPYAWYQLDSADGDPSIFLSYLVACAQQIETSIYPERNPRLGKSVESLLEDSKTPSPDRALIVFINEMAAHLKDDYLFILEDYHLITNPDVHRLVNTLLSSGLPQMHLVISTRTDPPLGLGRLRARGWLAEFRAPDLRFEAEEVQTWMDQLVPGTPVVTARLLNEKTEGWAAALQIILSALEGQDVAGVEEFVINLTGTQRYIFEYLAEEVFQQHTLERQEFLTRTAVLDQMDAATCNFLLNTNTAQIILDNLEKDNLFIISLDEQREWYRYHHLFRDFLLGKLRRESPDIILQMEEKAGHYYQRQGEFKAAFAHFIRAQKFDDAAEVLSIFARDYVERGRVAVLQRFLGFLPDAAVQKYPELLLQHGNVLWRLGRSGSAVSRYEDARRGFNNRGDQAGVCRVLTQMAEMARSQGDYRQAQKLALEALDYLEEDQYAGRAKTLMVLAKSEGFLTGMDRGHELGVASVSAARKAGESLSKRTKADLLRSLGHICWWYGDPAATLRYCQEALALVSKESPIAAAVYIMMATPYVYCQELDKAREYSERGLEIAQQLKLPEILPRAHSILGSILSRGGEIDDGEYHLRKAVEMAQASGLESYARVMAVGYLAQNLCVQGRLDQARQLAEEILWEQAANPNTYEIVVTRSVLADIALESNRLDEAQEIFESLEEIAQRRKFRIPLAMIYFGLAFIQQQKGHIPLALEYAQKSIEIIEPLGTSQLYLDQGHRARSVCQLLKNAGNNTPFVEDVLRQLPGAEMIELLGDQPAVRVQCLGDFRVFVADNEITQEQWVSTKARDMLAYFITHRHKHMPLEKAEADIWPDQNQQGRAFHSALYRLRHALRQEKEKTKFIKVKSGEYWLEIDQFKLDVDEFEFYLAKAEKSAASESYQWRLEAISLYKGDYLRNLLYYDWANDERQRLEKKYIKLLVDAAQDLANREDYLAAVQLVSQAIERDSLRESLYRQAMDYYAAANNRSDLIGCYQQLKQVLDESLSLQPAIETQQHFQYLLAEIE